MHAARGFGLPGVGGELSLALVLSLATDSKETETLCRR